MALERGRDMYMVRPDLENLPDYPLPDGYVLDSWRPGDDHEWLRIHLLADYYNDFTEDTFRATYGIDDRLWAERIFLLRVRGGPTIGTAAAWWDDNWQGRAGGPESWGQVHWVAIVPSHQGRGLARPLISATLHRLRDLGHTRAFLSTNSVRENAIRLYESFGFAETEP